jgi:pantoate--beta-alanine ligase
MPKPRLVERIAEMQAACRLARANAETIALVPTMGALHDGHLSLVAEGRRRADLLVISIFVNPAQFGPHEDFAAYPRDLEGDLDKGSAADIAFAPSVGEMYPAGFQSLVEVSELSRELEGAHRPTHFRGVTTVVAKLLNIVRPHVAIFGEKDYQQLQVVRRMVQDLAFDVEILGMPIVRDSDGLALSSRNAYLSPRERAQATSLSRALFRAETLFRKRERRAEALAAEMTATISREPDARIDYIEVRRADDLAPLSQVNVPAVCLLAVRVGRTRLIDNCLLRP